MAKLVYVVPKQAGRGRAEVRKYLSFITFMVVLVIILTVVTMLKVSPLLAGLTVFAVAVWFMIGEFIPAKYERIKPFYYMLGLGLALVLWGASVKGYLPLALHYATPSYTEFLLMTFVQSLIIAGIIAGAVVLAVLFFLGKLPKPKLGTKE